MDAVLTPCLVPHQHSATSLLPWDRGAQYAHRVGGSGSFWDLFNIKHWICATTGITTGCPECTGTTRHHSYVTTMLCAWVKVEK